MDGKGHRRLQLSSLPSTQPTEAMIDHSDKGSPQPKSSPSADGDRVFPIRNMVTIDQETQPTAGTFPILKRSTTVKSPGSLQMDELLSGDSTTLHNQPVSNIESLSASDSSNVDTDLLGIHMTKRFEYKQTEEGHMVIGLEGRDRMYRCEDEPIHLPGSIQSFGAVCVLEKDDEDNLVVLIASENSAVILGYSPSELLRLRSFTEIFSEGEEEIFNEQLEFLYTGSEADKDSARSDPTVFPLCIDDKKGKIIELWCAIHESSPGRIFCEFELQDDHLFPLGAGKAPSTNPQSTIGFEPTEDERLESITDIHRPLRQLSSIRRRRGGSNGLAIYSIMSQITDQLNSAPNLDIFYKTVCGIVKEVTEFHRVMIYQFDSEYNGNVVAELVSEETTKDYFLGLHFPSTDIPAQARQLYLQNQVRILYDRDAETARLVCRREEKPVDMTHSYLRAMSPVHLEYLKNMQVRASMSLSIVVFGRLYGLVSCHSYGDAGMRVSFPVRKLCKLISDQIGRDIERLSYASRLHARSLINTVPTDENPSGYIIASSDDLLNLFKADFGVLSIRNETKILGKVVDSQEALAMLAYLREKQFTTIVYSNDIQQDFPDLNYAKGFEQIAGLLLVPLSVQGVDFIALFRNSQVQTVRWAGNPLDKVLKAGSAMLEPRKSFKVWSEQVGGKCKEWTAEQIESASVLCLIYGKFIEVWRQKEAALQNSQLTKLLLANASHEVRTPLNQVINFLEIALEGQLPGDVRDSLSKSHSASKSLIYAINDLLDLARLETNKDLLKVETFDIAAIINDLGLVLRQDAERKGLDFQITQSENFPKKVNGDERKLRTAVTNIATNGIKYTQTGFVRLSLMAYYQPNNRCIVEIITEDSGIGMSEKEVNTLFEEFENVENIEQEAKIAAAIENAEESVDSDAKAIALPGKQKMLGLGLAVVARTVKNMNGTLRIKTSKGNGCLFTLRLPFDLPDDESDHPKNYAEPSAAEESEILLVDSKRKKTTNSKNPGLTRARSLESRSSFHSNSTGSGGASTNSGKSELDRLVDAFVSSSPVSSTVMKDDLPRRPSAFRRLSENSVSTLKTAIANRVSGAEATAGSGPGEASTETPSERVLLEPQRDNASAQRVSESKKTAFHVLVAEDDPINANVISKRLSRAGCTVDVAYNGQRCVDQFVQKGHEYDVVLMDIQMPIWDGMTATKKIREHESIMSPCKQRTGGRIPIFAVSASLLEEKFPEYISFGFDGWIMKPIDFERLKRLLSGIADLAVREEDRYRLGVSNWESGGWLLEDR